ncbi:MAG: Type A flavoprotein FprA [Candidatus Syntrophoarchaeum sp. GoM_oil]|nr:MAG: Type A flavoprotein FprA [Candidatus Syntrophoarchaeum sp. GoM_oil]
MAKLEIVYFSQLGHTKKMASAIAEGAGSKGVDTTIKPVSMLLSINEIEGTDAIAIGAPTQNSNIPRQVRTLLEKMEGLNLGGMPAAAFGSYGFSGEAPDMISDKLRSMGMDVVGVVRALKKPDETVLAECRKLGEELALKIEG